MKSYAYFDSEILKELVKRRFQQLTVNRQSDNEMFSLYTRVEELTPSDFGDDTANVLTTKTHICYTHSKRKEINTIVMKQDKLKRKQMLAVLANPSYPNSQDVQLYNKGRGHLRDSSVSFSLNRENRIY